jgi:thioesterase domain-containing protein
MRDFLRQKLPDYMIPSAFMVLDAFPLTPNGKIDHRSLPAPESSWLEAERDYREPGDSLELQIVKIWENLLGVYPIGITDNFFELGGHSLMAARMFSHIEKMTGTALALGTLFEAPTVTELAETLRRKGWVSQWQSLVPIQSGGNRRPLFLVHPMSGNVLGYADLARHLGPDQPVYGLQALGLDGKRAPFTRVEDMAAHYLEEVKTMFPEGPYVIGGRCSIGGFIAFEMVQQLVAQGQEVALLVFFDVPGVPSLIRPFKRPHHRKSMLRYPRRRINEIMNNAKNMFDPQARRFQRVIDANYRARDQYIPKTYCGRIVFFLSEGHRIGHRYDPRSQSGWAELAHGGLELHIVPGDHSSMLRPPHVRIVAEQLREYLDEAAHDG